MTANAKIHSPTGSLYEEDFNHWLLATAQQLREKRFDEIDLENLIEEIESMGRSDRRALKSLLTRLLEHLIKLTYWESELERCGRGWRREIRNFRSEIKNLLEDSPSLKPYLKEVFRECYLQGRLNFIDESGGEDVPVETGLTIEQVLDPSWLPIDIEG